LTAQGSSRPIFKRAIQRENLLSAEMAAFEMGHVTLAESLALTALVAQKDPGRRSRYTVRWLRRLLEEDEHLSIEEASLAASALAALGSRRHAEALSTLSAMVGQASGRRARRRPASVR